MNISNGYDRIFQFDFQVNRRDNGTLAGFTLNAQKQGEAEFFCKTFPKALFTGKGPWEYAVKVLCFAILFVLFSPLIFAYRWKQM
jgi:hypothetical protein